MDTDDQRIIDPELHDDEIPAETSLRPPVLRNT
jgi:hypothetical protein